ncbi:MAG: LCP family protein [Clostridia bacterium]|nr:LCP family protein [Clostridia bacterium]
MANHSKGKKILITVLCIILALIILAVSTFFVLYLSGKSKFHKNDRNIKASNISGLEIDEDTVEYNGEKYKLNNDIVSILIMGIDKNRVSDNMGIGKNGQADALFLMTLNTQNKGIKIIPIPREAMADIDIYSKSGKFSGTENGQICLSYAYGKNANDSCENTKKSAERLLLNINIGNYLAIDLKSISVMTDKIGGITLNCIETLPEFDCVEGKSIFLKGDRAQYYLQARSEDITGSTKRIERQKQFLDAFASKAGNKIMGDFGLIKDYYDTMKPYICTDLSFSQITYLASTMISKNVGSKFDYLHIDGETKMGEEWVEFYPDDDSLVKVILDAFYKKK